MKNLIFFTLISIGIFSSSCDESISCPNMEEHHPDAILRWTGDYALDGCGYIIVMDQVEYKPLNENVIDPGYKLDYDVKVAVTYEIPHDEKEIACGMTKEPVYREGIQIISLEKK